MAMGVGDEWPFRNKVMCGVGEISPVLGLAARSAGAGLIYFRNTNIPVPVPGISFVFGQS